ncbi:MAG TPA: ABC transporter permease [Acidimicrobiales bacterium]
MLHTPPSARPLDLEAPPRPGRPGADPAEAAEPTGPAGSPADGSTPAVRPDRTTPNDQAETAALAEERAALVTPEFLGQRGRPRWLVAALRASVPVALVVTWWIGSGQGWIPDHILSRPADVWDAFVELWRAGDLTTYVAASFRRAASGLVIGVGVGLLLGVASGLSSVGEDLVDPTMQAVRAIPFLALVPLYLAWFGVDETFKVVLIASSSAVPMYTYTYLGVRNVDRKVVEAARGFGLRGGALVRRVVLPSALPSVLMGLRICLVLSMTALISAEGVGTEEGIGYLVLLARQYARTDYTVLCVVLYAGVGLAFDVVIRLAERYSMPWRRYTAVRG